MPATPRVLPEASGDNPHGVEQEVVTQPSVVPTGDEAVPHECSFTVWDIPGAVGVEDMFTPTVGINCSYGCALGGEHIEVLNPEGEVAAEATLSDEPWPGTRALYTASVRLCAPPAPGRGQWIFRVVPRTHDRAFHVIPGAVFEATICARPQHNVTVSIVQSDTRLPVAQADVRLGPYRAITNDLGIATIGAARGAYVLDAWKAGYADCDGGLVQVDGDIAIALETATVATRPEDEQVWM
jgi:hypothetical protein